MPRDHPSSTAPAYVQGAAGSFVRSLAVDRRLIRFDLAGSMIHAEMLGRTGIISRSESARLQKGLRRVAWEVSQHRFPWRPELEDVHTNVEVRLTELIGRDGGKLHTGRSRNDQIALDERLYLRAAVRDIALALRSLLASLLARAENARRVPMPGYTHLQRAQPVTVGHWWLAHFWRFDRDLDRFLTSAARANVSPLGAGALAGSTLPVDPAFVARRLGFDRAFENSLDAVSDRDPFAELLFDLALSSVHASGLSEEVAVFASQEFGFIRRTAALGTGSSQMPQKRNPDVVELIRGRSGRSVGNLVALLVMLKGLPMAYNRDLQEDKAIVFDSVDAYVESLSALTLVVRELEFDEPRLRAAASDPALRATDVAEAWVASGVPFREAHEALAALAAGGSRSKILAELRGRYPHVDFSRGLAAIAAIRRDSPGGPGPVAIGRQLRRARSRLNHRRRSLSTLDRWAERLEKIVPEEPK